MTVEIVEQIPATMTTDGDGNILESTPGSITIRHGNSEEDRKAAEKLLALIRNPKKEKFSERYAREQRERNRLRKKS